MKLKANLHFHTNDDPTEAPFIAYNAFEAIDAAEKRGFEVIAITLHNLFYYNDDLVKYASSKNILLIPGIEKTIEGRHTVILNADKEAEAIKTFADLALYRAKKKDIFILVPHPFFYGNISWKEKVELHSNLSDALEYSWFYCGPFNRNLKAKQASKHFNLPLLATSDTHRLSLLENSYAILEVEEKSIPAVFKAIRTHSFQNITRPATPFEFLYQLFLALRYPGELIKNR